MSSPTPPLQRHRTSPLAPPDVSKRNFDPATTWPHCMSLPVSRLQPLASLFVPSVLCFQCLAASFAKNGGGGYMPANPQPRMKGQENDTRLTQFRFHSRTLPIPDGHRSPVLFADRRPQFLVLPAPRVLSTQRIRKLPGSAHCQSLPIPKCRWRQLFSQCPLRPARSRTHLAPPRHRPRLYQQPPPPHPPRNRHRPLSPRRQTRLQPHRQADSAKRDQSRSCQ